MAINLCKKANIPFSDDTYFCCSKPNHSNQKKCSFFEEKNLYQCKFNKFMTDCCDNKNAIDALENNNGY